MSWSNIDKDTANFYNKINHKFVIHEFMYNIQLYSLRYFCYDCTA